MPDMITNSLDPDFPVQNEHMDAFELYCIENGITLNRFADSAATKTVEEIVASALPAKTEP
jgi:hypothetical protein